MGRKVTKENNLFVKFPNIAKEWHPEANEGLTPRDFLPFSGKKAWWICPEGHEYHAAINNRTSLNSGCPYCRGLKVTKDRNFATLHPNQAAEWDYEKNLELRPDNFSEFSGKKVWWKCKKGHEWLTTIAARSSGSGCPFCWKHTSAPEYRLLSELEIVFKKVIRRRKFSGLEVDIFIEKYQIGIEYDGSYWHKNREARDLKKQERLASLGIMLIRVRESPLTNLSELDVISSARGLEKKVIDELLVNIKPFCQSDDINRINSYIANNDFQNEQAFKNYLTELPEPDQENSLDNEDEELLLEFDFNKNHPLKPKNFSRGSQEKVWWKCKNGHSWLATVLGRTVNKSGCPYCSRNFASPEVNLQSMFPEVASQWHPTKNGSLSPSDVLPASSIKRWWICKSGHEWQISVANRTKNKSGCPYCTRRLSSDNNNLAFSFPRILKLWHPTKNNNGRPDNLLPSSGRKIWLICEKGHEWETVPNNIQSMLKDESADLCPICRRLNNSLARKFPEILKEWDFEKNSEINPDTVSYGSKKKYWWICSNNHSWEASPNQRTKPKPPGCPLCIKQARS